MKLLEQIFSVSNDNHYHKIWTILGIKLKFKMQNKYLADKLITQINHKIEPINNEFSELNSKLEHLDTCIKNINNKFDTLNDIEQINARFYSNKFELNFIEPFFRYIESSNFSNKYQKFINNLSNDDIKIINKIIARIRKLKQLKNGNGSRCNLYSQEEQSKKVKLLETFKQQVVKINDTIFAYGKYKLPINHFEICVFCYKHGIEQVYDLEKIRTKNIIDAGAFIGDSALVLADYTDKKIYSFEINPQNFEHLEETIKLNHLEDKVVPVQKALYSSKCALEFNLYDSASSLTRLEGINYSEQINVQTITLDEFVEKNNLEVGCIKIDLEGAEQEFIKGAINTIKQQKPTLLFSIYHKPEDLFEIKPIIEELNIGYEFKLFNPVDYSILIETMLIAEVKEG